jgi:hypothetical protein
MLGIYVGYRYGCTLPFTFVFEEILRGRSSRVLPNERVLFGASYSSIKRLIPGFKKKKASILLDEYFNISYAAATFIFGLIISIALLRPLQSFQLNISPLLKSSPSNPGTLSILE